MIRKTGRVSASCAVLRDGVVDERPLSGARGAWRLALMSCAGALALAVTSVGANALVVTDTQTVNHHRPPLLLSQTSRQYKRTSDCHPLCDASHRNHGWLPDCGSRQRGRGIDRHRGGGRAGHGEEPNDPVIVNQSTSTGALVLNVTNSNDQRFCCHSDCALRSRRYHQHHDHGRHRCPVQGDGQRRSRFQRSAKGT